VQNPTSAVKLELAPGTKLVVASFILCAPLLVLVLLAPWNSQVVLLAVLAAIGFVYVVGWHPLLVLVAAIFIPQWKAYWPLEVLDQKADLTAVMLAGLVMALSWQVVKRFARIDRSSLPGLFRGLSVPLWLFLLFIVLLTSSYLYTAAPQYGAQKLTRVLLIGGLLLLAALVLIRNDRDLKRFAVLFILCGMVSAAQLLLNLQRHRTDSNTDVTRIGAGWLIGMSILLLLAYPIFRNAGQQLTAWLVALPLLAGGLVGSVSRGAIIPLIVLAPLTFFFFARRRLTVAAGLLVTTLLACSGGAYYLIKKGDPEKFSSKASELVSMMEGRATKGSGVKRLDFYARTLTALPENLWFGQGVGSWSVFYYGADRREYPHNLFLEIAYEEGLVTLSVFLALLASVAILIRRLLRQTKHRYGALAGILLYCATVSMFSGDLDDNRLLWLWIGIALATYRNVCFGPLVLRALYLSEDPPSASLVSAMRETHSYNSIPSVT
jgi:O-antigen ligase